MGFRRSNWNMFRSGCPVGACCTVFVVICSVLQVRGVPLGSFFPFGLPGDRRLLPSDDGFDQVNLTLPFPFAGANSTEIYVCFA